MPTTTSKRTSTGPPKTSNSGRPAANGRRSGVVREVLAHPSVVPLASLTSLGRLFAVWAESADRCAQAVSDEFLSRVHDGTAMDELLRRLATISKQHLGELGALPREVADHFGKEFRRQASARPSRWSGGGRRSRSA
jgi:hypothetical protein